MKRYYVAFLANDPRKNHPFEILYPHDNPRRQFDTIPEARVARDLHRGAPYQTEVGSWEVIDLFATAKSPMLIVLD